MQNYTNFEAHASKRVSFIITTKNRAEHLRKALVLHHKLIHPDDELIIVDGLSTDHTAEVVNEYANLVDLFISEPDKSGAHALNKGILISRGKYIKQLPDDDVFYPEAMEQAIRVMEEHPEVDLLVCGGTRQIGERVNTVCLPPGTNYGSSVEDVFKYGATGVGFIYRRSGFSQIGLFHPTNLAADKEFVLNAIKNGANVKFCRINLYHHPILEHSVTVKYAQNHKNHSYGLIKQYCSKRFYYQFRLDRWFRKYALYRLIRLPSNFVTLLRREGILGALRRIVQILLRKKVEPVASVEARDYMWDGGFS